MEDNNTIIFRMGEETGIVIEKTKEQFEHSLFKEQYRQVFDIMDTIIERSTPEKGKEVDDKMSNIIVFCGDRGEGKTSALETVRGILSNKTILKDAQLAGLFSEKSKLDTDSFKVLRLVDPAFFDDKHNLMELLIGQMYADVLLGDKEAAEKREFTPACMDLDVDKRTQLVRLFKKVRTGLGIVHKPSDKSAYDNLEEIDQLAAGTELKTTVNELLQCYAKYFKKERVLICIDDLDLNATEGYTMAEEIRKYLSSPTSCMVLMAVKIEQMIEVVQSYLRENLSKIVSDDTIKEMAIRYVAKLMPSPNRIIMPSGQVITESRLQIEDGEDKELYYSVKEAVVQLIYRKTRYIFINGRNVSPIVPNNLRSLRHLMELLWRMPDAKRENNVDNVDNKQIFKNYFFNTWTRLLNSEDVKFIEDFVQNKDIITLNKSVITHLKKRTIGKGTYIEDEVLEAILNPQNQVQNISVGDVFYVINYVDSINTDKEVYNLLFFLKALYSIELYETYNFVSSSFESLFITPSDCLPISPRKEGKENEDSNVRIYKYDTQLRKLNLLQRLLNGAYFTYKPGSLIPSEKNGRDRDLRQINGDNLRKAFGKIKDSTISSEEQTTYLQLCEFFALTTIRAAKKEGIFQDRTLSGRAYFDSFDTSDSTYVFDVLSMFYNVVNIQFTYNRWDKIFKEDFFAYAYNHEESLLRKALAECDRVYDTPDSTLPSDFHHLISDAIIRFSELMLSIIDNAENQRDVYSEGGNANNLKIFYDNIRKIGITLYPLDPTDKEDIGYILQFKFLTNIVEWLKIVDTEKFDAIFSSAKDNTPSSLNKFFESILSGVEFPITGKEINQYIKQTYPVLYKKFGGYKIWRSVLRDKVTYSNVKSAVDTIMKRTPKALVLEELSKTTNK